MAKPAKMEMASALAGNGAELGARTLSRDAVIVSGDIANTPTAFEYDQAHTVLGALDAPLYVLPGTHDDRDLLLRHFHMTHAEDGRASYVGILVSCVSWRWTRYVRGAPSDRPQLAWLDRRA